MATTLKTDLFNPEILEEAVKGVFAGKNAFLGSRLASLGVAVVSGSMPQGGPNAIGSTITMPYFGTLGEFVANAEGNSVTPSKIGMVTETATISRDSLAFEVTQWAIGNSLVNPAISDPYEESARQIMIAAERAMDKRLIDAAGASGVYVKDVYSATTPVTINWDLFVDAKFEAWGDEQDDVVAILTHSHGHKDMMKLKDSAGRPLLLNSLSEGNMADLDRFAGLPVIVSDRVPLTASAMGTVTSSGTSPPVLTITGTPLGAYKLVIDCVVGGAHQTATYRFSTDGGNTWSATLTTPAAATPTALIDTAVDSLVGMNGKTGLSVAFAAGTFNADNLWTSTASLKVTSMLLKRRSLAFWYSSGNLGLDTDKDILKHSKLAAMHLYGAAHRYRRHPAGTKPGVVHISHNVSGF